MSGVLIAEKAKVAKLLRSRFGLSLGRVVTASGHLFELQEPHEVNPEWRRWSAELLRPASGHYPVRFRMEKRAGAEPTDEKAKRLYGEIRTAARSARRIYVVTDPDREGEGIGGDILRWLERDLGQRWEVLRVLPLAADEASLRRAVEAARPIAEFRGLYQAYRARQLADQIVNLSLTRAASELLREAVGEGRAPPLSIGRVLTPTMGIVVRRERGIRTFVPRDYFHPWVEVENDAGCVRLVHRPKDDERIWERRQARAIAEGMHGWTGAIRASTERKRHAPPRLFRQSTLNKEASRRLGWGIERTKDVLQRLYDLRELVTYPRSDEESLPEADAANAPALMAAIVALPFGAVSWSAGPPVIRRAKGAFSDAALAKSKAAHTAIVPNVETVSRWPAIWERLEADERALFEIVARRYLAALGPDRVTDVTRLAIEGEGRTFEARGVVERVAGWREAVAGPAADPRRGPENRPGEPERPEEALLPPFEDGQAVRGVDAGVEARRTECPPRYTTATLQTEMVEAWRHETCPTKRSRLKEAKGIGTAATQEDIVPGLRDRGYVTVEGRDRLHATARAERLFEVLERHAPMLLDVGLTAEMEMGLDEVQAGRMRPMAAVDAMCEVALQAIEGMRAAHAAGDRVPVEAAPTKDGRCRGKRGSARRRTPTDRMIAAARSKARREGVDVPAAALQDFDACRAFLGPMRPSAPARSGGRATPR